MLIHSVPLNQPSMSISYSIYTVNQFSWDKTKYTMVAPSTVPLVYKCLKTRCHINRTKEKERNTVGKQSITEIRGGTASKKGTSGRDKSLTEWGWGECPSSCNHEWCQYSLELDGPRLLPTVDGDETRNAWVYTEVLVTLYFSSGIGRDGSKWEETSQKTL